MADLQGHSKHPDFYFGDGNIILSVKKESYSNTVGGVVRSDELIQDDSARAAPSLVLFRVHKSVLSYHSETFSDIFSIPQSNSALPNISKNQTDGCDMVELHDTAFAVENLIRTMYGAPPKHKRFTKESFDTLASIIHLADKYHIPRYTTEFLPLIEQDWPSTLEEWDRVSELRKEAMKQAGITQRRTGGIKSNGSVFVDPVRVIRLAIDLNLPGMLPAAFYSATLLFLTGCHEVDRSLLRPSELLRLYAGERRLRSYALEIAAYSDQYDLFTTNNSHTIGITPRGQEPCSPPKWRRERVGTRLVQLLERHCGDVLAALEEIIRDFDDLTVDKSPRVCDTCKNAYRTELGNARFKVWAMLQQCFGI